MSASLYSRRSTGGFTIVELLIVIVVIAILAAISIVAFTSVQERARKAATIQSAHQIAKSFEAAVVQHQVNLGAHSPYCLPTGLSDIDGDGSPPCGFTAADGTYNRKEKTGANAMLESVELTSISFPSTEIVGDNGVKYRGIQVTYASGAWGVDGVHQPHFLYFFLKGANQDCGSSYSIGRTPGNDATANPLHAFTKAPRYASSNGVTTCAYTLLRPSNL